MSVIAVVRSLGGVARTSELAAHGYGAGAIRAALRSGDIVRARKGWWLDPRLPIAALRAVRVGGTLACASAAVESGLWTPEHDGLHVAVPPDAARLRSPDDARRALGDGDGVVVHWTGRSRAIQSVADIVLTTAMCCGPRFAFILLESALHRRMLTRPPAGLTSELAAWSRHASHRSESGGESGCKLILVGLGVPFRQQVWISGVGRVDFLVGRDLIVEIDGRSTHDHERDRRRDGEASIRGFRTLRFSSEQVMRDPEFVRAAIVGALVRGDIQTA